MLGFTSGEVCRAAILAFGSDAAFWTGLATGFAGDLGVGEDVA